MSAIDWHWDYDAQFTPQARAAALTVATAALLIIGGVIVITCASFCYMLPGVNVMQDIVLRGVLPGGSAILLSLPFILLSIKFTLAKKKIWKAWQGDLTSHLEEKLPTLKTETSRAEYIAETFFLKKGWGWTREYKKTLFKEQLKKYKGEEKKPEEEQDPFYKALTKAQELVFKKKK